MTELPRIQICTLEGRRLFMGLCHSIPRIGEHVESPDAVYLVKMVTYKYWSSGQELEVLANVEVEEIGKIVK